MESSLKPDVRAIAFYLPQFHPIPENNAWWGEGFTEWTNVVQAKKLYKNHYQPRLPSELGFYDLRVEETRVAQAELAKEYGVYGFCYYYYYFGQGRKLLNRPLDEVFATKKPNFPFCVCWANESWSRRWDGRNHDILIEQDVGVDTVRGLVRELIPLFQDERYIRVNGKPLLLIYRSNVFECLENSISAMRDEARKAGIDLYMVCAEIYRSGKKEIDAGFDAVYEFPNAYQHVKSGKNITSSFEVDAFSGYIGDYSYLANFYKKFNTKEFVRFKGVTLGWDNTARKKKSAAILENFSIWAYAEWLRECADITRASRCGDERLIFINAWNEWAEGVYLEPDTKFGRMYLEATKLALCG